MNKTEIVIKCSIPVAVVTGVICYKLGQNSVYVKAAREIINGKEKDTED